MAFTPDERKAWREANREKILEYQRLYRAAHGRTEERKRRKETDAFRAERKRWQHSLTGKRMNRHSFLGIDGEGWNDENGHHIYSMIVTSDPSLYLYTGEPLTSIECLAFLADLPKESKRFNVTFFFDYDVTMILRDFALAEPESALKLFEPGTRNYVWWEGFGIKYRPHKMLAVKRWHPYGSDATTLIHDGQGFFQSSFVNALRKFGVGSDAEFPEGIHE
jgi:hypothetical protein